MKDKKIVYNSIFNIVYSLTNILFPFLTSIYCSHILLPIGMGQIAFAQNIINYFVHFARLGIPNYGTKKIGAAQDVQKELNQNFSELMIISMAASLLSTLVFVLVYLFVPRLNGNYLLLILAAQIVFNFLNIDWLFQGIEEYKYITKRNMVVRILSFLLLVCFVRSKEDVGIYCMVYCGSSLLVYLSNFIYARKYVRFTFSGLTLTRHLKAILILLAASCAGEIYTLLDSTMIGLLRTEEELGFYSNSMKTVRTVYAIVMAMCAVFLPRLSLYFQKKEWEEYNKLVIQGFQVSLLLAVPCFIGMLLIGDRIIPLLYGRDFAPAVQSLHILSILIVVFSVAYSLGHIVLISSNHEAETLKATLTGAASNFILNLLLIPSQGYVGAAIASVIAEILVTVVLVYYSYRTIAFRCSVSYIVKIVAAAAIMGVGIQGIRVIIQGELPFVLMSIGAGSILYFSILWLFKNEQVMAVIAWIRRKVK
ncbi:MAG: flippase [Lachnospiraceae bacterium]|nr:flippase [Lachnospiraceae bacterium]